MAERIEIRTAHNIVVYFELAGLLDRVLSTIVDLIIMFVIAWFLVFMGFAIGLDNLTMTLVFLFIAFYHLVFEVFNAGQSPGKMLCKIKAVNMRGIPPNPSEAFQRWVFRMLDVTFSMGALAGLFITSSPKNQRLGDLMSGCAVIKLKKNADVPLDRVLRIQDREREILYPQVTQYGEKDMLLIKDVLQRSSMFKNESTRQAIRSLSKKLEQELSITDKRKDKKAFLEDVLKDYVSLTR